MNDAPHTRQSKIYAEDVIVGESSSRLSSFVAALTLTVPVVATVLFGAVDNISWVLLTVFWAAILLGWLADAWKGKGLLLNTSTLQLPLIGFFIIGIIQLMPLSARDAGGVLGIPVSSTLSLDPYSTRFFLLHLVVYIVFFAACLTFINNQGRLRKAVLMVIIFGAGMAFFGILQRLANPDGIYELRKTPQAIPFGPFVNRHHFAAFMEMTAGLAIGLLFGKTLARDKKVLLLIAVVVMGVALASTSSRGGMVGIVSVVIFAAILHFFSGRWSTTKRVSGEATNGIQSKAALAAIAAALVLVVFGIVLSLGGNDELFRGIGFTEVQGGVSNGRAHFWQVALQIFLEHPIIGAGHEAFGVAFTKYDTSNGTFRVEQAHNEYLQTLADSGIAGFICISVFIYLLFRKGLQTIAVTHGLRREAAIGALAGCFGLLIHSFFDFPLRTHSNAFFFLLLCSIAIAPIRSNRSEKSKRKRPVTAPSP